MKSRLKTVGLAIIASFLLVPSGLTQNRFIFPNASIFSPTAHLFKGIETDLIQWLEAYDASVLAMFLSMNNFESQLNTSQDVTLFVPTDEAFAKLPSDIRQKLSQPGVMERLLKYHMVNSIISEADIKDRQIVTAEGSAVKITGKTKDNGTTETRLNQAKIEQSVGLSENLMLLVIDEVLLPPNF